MSAHGLMSAHGARLPRMFSARFSEERRADVFWTELHRLVCARDCVDKISRGVNRGDIPVEQATNFDIVVNLTPTPAPPKNKISVLRRYYVLVWRITQRNPTWLVDVSIGSACRAAGRYRRQ